MKLVSKRRGQASICISGIGIWVAVALAPQPVFAFEVSVMPARSQSLQLVIESKTKTNYLILKSGTSLCSVHSGDIGKARWVGIAALTGSSGKSLIAIQVLNVRFRPGKLICDLFFGRMTGTGPDVPATTAITDYSGWLVPLPSLTQDTRLHTIILLRRLRPGSINSPMRLSRAARARWSAYRWASQFPRDRLSPLKLYLSRDNSAWEPSSN